MLDQRLEAVVEVLHQAQNFTGRKYHEVRLVDEEDAQTLHLYEGQLKECPVELREGERYRIRFKPFLNNHWLELKVVYVELETA